MVLSVRGYIRIRRLCTASISFLEPPAEKEAYHTHLSNRVDMLEINSQLRELIKTGNLLDARKMFDKMPQRDVITWTSMISGYVNAMNTEEALILFSNMSLEPRISIDSFVLSVTLKACGLNFNVGYGESLHGHSVKSGLVNSVFVGSTLSDMYTKMGKIEKGCRVFDEMPMKNVVSWTAIITGLVRAGYYKEGLMYLSEMWRLKVPLDSYTFAIALKACADSGALKYGREIHTHVIKKGFDSTVCVANSLSTMYNKCGKLDRGLHLFENMSAHDVVSWTSIITTYLQMGREDKAIEVFLQMRESGVDPNEFTFAAIFSACAGLTRLICGEQLHALVLRFGLENSLSVANSMMTMYSKCGQLNAASVVFHGMNRRDIISWSTIIGGYCQGGFGEEAFEYFSWMRREGPKPTDFSLASMLSVSGTMAVLVQGMQIHALVLSLGLEQEPTIRSALVNMYSKCGSIKEASKIFEEAESDDIVSWTAMINAYAEHGCSKEAIDLFEKSLKVGLKPDAVTFIGVLSACSHSGQLDLGFHYFQSMHKKYDIMPSKEHYGCMIDLLCRAGRLSEAEKMIKDMTYQKDDVFWSILLSACRFKGDVDRGRRVAEKILELKPSCAGTHIVLANIYSARGRWKEAADVRKTMKSKGLIKEPGWSWIKIKDDVSAFVAGDRSHSSGEDIYDVLESLASGAESPEWDLDVDLYNFEH